MSDPYSDNQDLLRTVKFDRVMKTTPQAPSDQPIAKPGVAPRAKPRSPVTKAHAPNLDGVDLQQTLAFKGVMKIPPGGGKPQLVIPDETPPKTKKTKASAQRTKSSASKSSAKARRNTKAKPTPSPIEETSREQNHTPQSATGISPLWIAIIVVLCLIIGILLTAIVLLLAS